MKKEWGDRYQIAGRQTHAVIIAKLEIKIFQMWKMKDSQ